ncbi:hypothetical protein FCV25MIE_03100 [Fagus crenata]
MCGAVGLGFEVAGFEGAVFKGRVGISGDTVGKGMLDGVGDVICNVGMALDVRVDGSLSDIGTEDRAVGNSDCGDLLDKGDDHDAEVLSEMLLPNDAEDET